MRTEAKIKRLLQLRKEILKESKKWKGGCLLKIYQTQTDYESNHRNLSQLFTGLGYWQWHCPFCNEEFRE